MANELIKGIDVLISEIHKTQQKWKEGAFPWFRGQNIDEPLLPKLFRKNGTYHFLRTCLFRLFARKLLHLETRLNYINGIGGFFVTSQKTRGKDILV